MSRCQMATCSTGRCWNCSRGTDAMGGCRVPHPKPALSVVEGPALAWVGILLGSWGRRFAQRPITQAPVVSPRFAYLPRHSAVTWASAITPGLRKPVEDKRRLKLNRLIHSFGILDYRGDGEQVGSAPSVEGTPLGEPLSPRCRTEAKSSWQRTRPVNRVLPLTFTFEALIRSVLIHTDSEHRMPREEIKRRVRM